MKSRMLLIAILIVLMAKAVFGSSVTDWRRDIQRGDIILVVNAWIPAWWYSLNLYDVGHVAIYAGTVRQNGFVWREQTVEASPAAGIVTHYHVSIWDDPRYRVFLLRPPAPADIKQQAVDYAISQIGESYSYNYTNTKPTLSNNEWYCTELVWSVYKIAGYELFYLPLAVGGIFEPRYGPIRPTRFFDVFGVTNQVGVHRETDPIPRDGYWISNTTSGLNFVYLKDALEDADEGDTIVVNALALREEIVVSKRNISLTSSRGTVLYTTERGRNTVEVTASGVTISRFMLANNRGTSDFNTGVGIYFAPGADNGTVYSVGAINNKVGVGLRSNGNVVRNCRFSYNKYGLALFQSDGNAIYRNVIYSNTETGLISTHDESQCASLAVINEYSSEPEQTGEVVRKFRDTILSRELVDGYYDASPALAEVFESSPEIKAQAWLLLKKFWPYVTGDKSDNIIQAEELIVVDDFISSIESVAVARIYDEKVRKLFDFISEVRMAMSMAVGQKFSEVTAGLGEERSESELAATATVQPTYFYLNDVFSNRQWSQADSDFFWYSPAFVLYSYWQGQQRNFYSGYLGNSWGKLDMSDTDGNGIYDANYGEDYYPLAASNIFYTIISAIE